eukprot:g32164.t1
MMAKQEAAAGVSFTTDLSNIGSGKHSRLFNTGAGGVLQEERRLIDKVFSIVDKDNSGQVDIEELKGMFKLFNVEASFLESAISRIMSNVDKDLDYMISPQEFYQLLSQKFEKDDPKEEIMAVFRRMDKNGDGHLDVDELHEGPAPDRGRGGSSCGAAGRNAFVQGFGFHCLPYLHHRRRAGALFRWSWDSGGRCLLEPRLVPECHPDHTAEQAQAD